MLGKTDKTPLKVPKSCNRVSKSGTTLVGLISIVFPVIVEIQSMNAWSLACNFYTSTNVTGILGNSNSGLDSAISVSFQFVISPVNNPATAFGLSTIPSKPSP